MNERTSPISPPGDGTRESHTAMADALRELEAARARITELTAELEETNRGIIALHTELEAAREAESQARADREVIAERDRIARDLHDLVIQRVFAAGMALQSSLGLIRQPQASARVRSVVDDLDATIRELRTAIFALHEQPQKADSLRAQVLELTRQAQDGLGFAPRLAFHGPLDAAVPDHIAADLLAVLREALSNAARHAHASRVEVSVSAADQQLTLIVLDDGRGLGHTSRSSGLTNMRRRAEAHDGTFEITGAPDGGTRLLWHVPLDGADGLEGADGSDGSDGSDGFDGPG